jgi:uncharacterized C2H2 Zn-finger protein
MDNNLVPKSSKQFVCSSCDYITSRESQYIRHLSTAKHQKITNGNNDGSEKFGPLTCKQCFQTFKYRSGLSRHQKKCTLKQEPVEEPVEEPIEDPPIETSQNPPIMPDMSVFIDLLKQNQEFKELMVEQSRQMQETQQENQELQKQLIEAVKVGQHIENQTNINNNNQRFNLNFFLNEQCKDAINMSDFLENMELNLEDLSETGRLGYVGGISRILVNKLQELDVYKRPMHCTDMKRETLYIKENDEWEKQVNSKEKIKTIITQVANKNCKNLPQWRDEHPESQVFDTPENLEYVNICNASLGGFGEDENRQYRDKILRSVVKEIMINK